MFVTLAGIVIVVKDWQSANESLILVTLLGIATSVRPVQ